VLRWLFRILAGLSALLCLGSISVWLRSYWAQDVIEHFNYAFPTEAACLDSIRIISADGEIYFNRMMVQTDYDAGNDDRQFYLRKNGWFYSPTYYFQISARDLFVREGGRACFGFGYKSTVWIEPSGSRYQARPNAQSLRHQLLIPWPVPVLMLSILPSLLLRSLVRSRRRRLRLSHNLCPSCGYDLRASPEKCPECGAIPISAVP